MLNYMDYSNEQSRQHCSAIHTAGELYMLAVLNHPLPTVGAITAHGSGLDLDVDRPRLDLGFTLPKDPLIAAGGIVAHGVDYGVSNSIGCGEDGIDWSMHGEQVGAAADGKHCLNGMNDLEQDVSRDQSMLDHALVHIWSGWRTVAWIGERLTWEKWVPTEQIFAAIANDLDHQRNCKSCTFVFHFDGDRVTNLHGHSR